MEIRNKAVFLDRDGTVIHDIIYLNDPSKIIYFPESFEAIKLMNEAGFLVFLATNQSGVARGIVDEQNVVIINDLIIEKFKSIGATISGAYYCPHPVDGGCWCRKPNPGMLESAAEKFNIDLKASWMMGDRMTDVQAGEKAGSKGILLQNEFTPVLDPTAPRPKYIEKNILTATKFILSQSN